MYRDPKGERWVNPAFFHILEIHTDRFYANSQGINIRLAVPNREKWVYTWRVLLEDKAMTGEFRREFTGESDASVGNYKPSWLNISDYGYNETNEYYQILEKEVWINPYHFHSIDIQYPVNVETERVESYSVEIGSYGAYDWKFKWSGSIQNRDRIEEFASFFKGEGTRAACRDTGRQYIQSQYKPKNQ